jgi:DNA polymerase III alpha subunit
LFGDSPWRLQIPDAQGELINRAWAWDRSWSSIRTDAEIAAVWKLLIGFMGYAFCRAHLTAYGVEAYEAAHLKRYYPAEFLSCVLTHGKGFYSRLVYSLECRRLGIGFLLPDVNLSLDAYFPEGGSIRVPVPDKRH